MIEIVSKWRPRVTLLRAGIPESMGILTHPASGDIPVVLVGTTRQL